MHGKSLSLAPVLLQDKLARLKLVQIAKDTNSQFFILAYPPYCTFTAQIERVIVNIHTILNF